MPSDVMLEGLYRQNYRILLNFGLCWLLYDQETARNNRRPNYSHLETAVKLHIDQMMRTRNFRVRSDLVERGSVTESRNGKKAYVERTVGECFQWKAHGQCSKGDTQSQSWHNSLWKLARARDKKGRSSSPASHSKAKQTDWRRATKNPQTNQARKRKALQIEGARFHADTEFEKNRHVSFGTLPCVRIRGLKKAIYGDKTLFRHVQAAGKRKEVQKDQLRCWMNLYNWVVYLKILIRESLFYVNLENLGSKHAANFSKGTWHQIF